ncbi:MAG: hypothetical protein AB7G44_08305 [Bacteroidia bacterium]
MHYYLTEDAVADLQNGVRWYNNQQAGLGKRFYSTAVNSIKEIAKRPLSAALRYDEVRCYPVKKFPYMIHFLIHENSMIVLGVINTALNPETNWRMPSEG